MEGNLRKLIGQELSISLTEKTTGRKWRRVVATDFAVFSVVSALTVCEIYASAVALVASESLQSEAFFVYITIVNCKSEKRATRRKIQK